MHLTDDDCAKGYGFKKKNTIAVRRDHITEEPKFFENRDWDLFSLEEFVWEAVTPDVFEFTQTTYELLYYQRKTQIFLFRMVDWDDKEDYELTFAEVAANNQG